MAQFSTGLDSVPVSNAQGAETAQSVQALLHFLPDDREGAFSPRDAVLAEWEADNTTTTIDIPGNGQPQVFDVALVLNQGHPCVFEWTKNSRAARLDGYGVAAGPAFIKVEVRGSGPGDAAPSISDTLEIDVRNGMIRADWASRDPNEEGNNWVPK